jgi:hypothetical protein
MGLAIPEGLDPLSLALPREGGGRHAVRLFPRPWREGARGRGAEGLGRRQANPIPAGFLGGIEGVIYALEPGVQGLLGSQFRHAEAEGDRADVGEGPVRHQSAELFGQMRGIVRGYSATS